MKVFKGYLRIVGRNTGLLVMYFAITIGVVFTVQKSMSYDNTGGFAAVRHNIAVLDREGGIIADTLKQYIELTQNLVEIEDDMQMIQDELFYRNISYVLIVSDDAQERLASGETAVQTIKVPGTLVEYYLDAKINNLLNQIRVCCAGGFSMEEACEKALELSQKEPDITLLDINGNAGQRPGYNYFFAYLPYGLLSGLIMCMSTVIMEFKKREVKRRIQCSPVSLRVQNMAAIACFCSSFAPSKSNIKRFLPKDFCASIIPQEKEVGQCCFWVDSASWSLLLTASPGFYAFCSITAVLTEKSL